jgi:malonyl-CoA O-methyltransferase
MQHMTDVSQIDKWEVRRAFDRAARNYDAHSFLQREISDRLLERLDYLKLEPGLIVDAGCGTCYSLRCLAERFPRSSRLALDLSPAMLKEARGGSHWWKRALQGLKKPVVSYVCGDLEQLPIGTSKVDFVWSSLAFQWVVDLESTFRELHRVQRPGGAILFATFGPDTLKELREAFSMIDDRPHVSNFIDMHDIGDMLTHVGYQHPVMEMEHITLTYENLKGLMKDLKSIGAHNAASDRPRGMLGRQAWGRLENSYERYRIDGRLQATYEVVYGHAWVGDKSKLADGRQIVQFNIEQRRSAKGMK